MVAIILSTFPVRSSFCKLLILIIIRLSLLHDHEPIESTLALHEAILNVIVGLINGSSQATCAGR